MNIFFIMEEQKGKNRKIDKQKKIKQNDDEKLNSLGPLFPTTNNFEKAITGLPESFFEKIILLEIDLSEEFSMDKFYELIKLYSDAIEYYMQHDASQVEYFRGRMEFLLTNRDTLKRLKKESQLLNNKYKNKKVKNSDDINNIIGSNSDNKILNMNEIKKIKIKNLNKSELIKNIENRTDNLFFHDISEQMNKVMEENNINNKKNKKGIDIITADLNNQNDKWKEKLKKKKKNKLKSTQNMPQNLRMKYQKELNIDLVNNFSDDIIGRVNINNKEKEKEREEDDEEETNMNQFEKMQNIFNEGIPQEVKKVNGEEGYDKENEIKIENKNEIIIYNKFKGIDNKNNNISTDNAENKSNCIFKKDEMKEPEAEIEIDENILASVNERINLLMKLIDHIENNNLTKDDEDENINETNIIDENDGLKSLTNIIKVPLKFQSIYFQVEKLIMQYMEQFNNFFFKEIFEQFASNLKEIYDNKYKKYIEISLEYHHQIKENEHLLENHEDYSEDKKSEIQQIIDSLKDEHQNQIAKIEDEFNRLIVSKVNEFKIDSFKNNIGILLIEEKLKLEIYSIINEAFYGN